MCSLPCFMGNEHMTAGRVNEVMLLNITITGGVYGVE